MKEEKEEVKRDNCEGNPASADEIEKAFQDEIAITLQYASRALCYKLFRNS